MCGCSVAWKNKSVYAVVFIFISYLATYVEKLLCGAHDRGRSVGEPNISRAHRSGMGRGGGHARAKSNPIHARAKLKLKLELVQSNSSVVSEQGHNARAKKLVQSNSSVVSEQGHNRTSGRQPLPPCKRRSSGQTGDVYNTSEQEKWLAVASRHRRVCRMQAHSALKGIASFACVYFKRAELN